jgi:hypothetical protein
VDRLIVVSVLLNGIKESSMISKIPLDICRIYSFPKMLCGQKSEYDAGFNVPSQTIECGIVTYPTVDSRGRIEH